MPRPVPHFKSLLSLEDHPELIGNDHAFATYHRVGHLAVRRMAAKNGGVVRLGVRDRKWVSARSRLDIAEKSLRYLEAIGLISVRLVDEVWEITLPNFAESQGFNRRNGTETVQERGPSQLPDSQSPSTQEKRREEREPAAVAAPAPAVQVELPIAAERKAAHQKRAKAHPPEQLDAVARVSVRSWCAGAFPHLVARVLELEAECLDYFRGKGEMRPDWPATVRTWIRREAKGGVRGGQQRPALRAVSGGRAAPGDPDGDWRLREDEDAS